MILVLAVHETEDLAVACARTVTWVRVTDFWTCVVLGLARNFCGLLEWRMLELNPVKTRLNSAIRISSSAMIRWYAFERIVAG